MDVKSPTAWGRRLRVPAAIAAIVAVGALLLVRTTDTPQERADASRPPARPVVTAAVEERILSDVIVIDGEVSSAETLQVSPQSSSAVGGDTTRPVVTTAAPEVGAVVDAGDLLVAISGQPVFLLQGELPLYRTIRPQDTGPDVEAVQRGLRSAGFDVVVDGVYGSSTWNAVGDLWRSQGFEPVVDETVEAEIDAAAAALEDLREQRDAATASIEGGGAPVPDLTGDIDAAEEQLSSLEAAFGPLIDSGSFVMAPVVPATVVASDARLGDDLTAGGTSAGATDASGESIGSLLELSASPPVITLRATAAQASLLEVGHLATATIDGVEVAAPIDSIGAIDEAGIARVIVRPDPSPALELLGTAVSAEVETVSSGSPVTAVPTSAVRSTPGEPDHVLRVTSAENAAEGDARESVTVETGAVIGGWVEITSSRPGLTVGDLVIVGE